MTKRLQLLLAEVKAWGGELDNLLQAASYPGRLEIYGSVLQVALYRDRLNIVKLLLENGADVNATGREYGTALHVARVHARWRTRAKKKAVAELLKEYGVVETETLPQSDDDAQSEVAQSEDSQLDDSPFDDTIGDTSDGS